MTDLLTQHCTHKSTPTLDKFGKPAGWKSSVTKNCRVVVSQSFSTNSKGRLQTIDAVITLKSSINIGDHIVYNGVSYKVYSVNEWRNGTVSYGYQAKLILV